MWLEVHFLDVGQGDGIWIHTPDDGIDGNGIYEGRNIVMDGGPKVADAENPMLAYLLEHAHEGAIVDELIITHPHDDHYPGAKGVLAHFDVRECLEPVPAGPGTLYGKFLDKVHAERCEGQPIVERVASETEGPLDWGSELDVKVLSAYDGDPTGLGSGNTLQNNQSIVVRLQYGSQSFLFVGDAEGKERPKAKAGETADEALQRSLDDSPLYLEKRLLDRYSPAELHATVLKLGHHGSETSSSPAFIAAVDPKVAIVCSGRKSFSGTFLPDDSVLERYCCHDQDLRIYRTDLHDEQEGHTTDTDADGDHVVVKTNGTTLEVVALSHGAVTDVSSCEPPCPH